MSTGSFRVVTNTSTVSPAGAAGVSWCGNRARQEQNISERTKPTISAANTIQAYARNDGFITPRRHWK